MEVLIEKQFHLSDLNARRLASMAAATQSSEDELIARALSIMFDLSDGETHTDERKAWHLMSQESFQRVWDNDADAVYDNWQELYEISKG